MTTVTPDREQQLANESHTQLARAESLAILNQAGLDQAAAFLRDVKDLRAKVDDAYDGIIRKAHEAHKEAIATKRRYSDPLDRVERILKDKIGSFQLAEARKREEERRRLEEAARQEEERKRLEAAIEMEKQGDKAAASALLEAPLPPPTVYVPPAPKAEGVTTRMEWTFEIVNPHLVPREYCEPDPVKIRAFVRAVGGMKELSGVKIFRRPVVTARGR